MTCLLRLVDIRHLAGIFAMAVLLPAVCGCGRTTNGPEVLAAAAEAEEEDTTPAQPARRAAADNGGQSHSAAEELQDALDDAVGRLQNRDAAGFIKYYLPVDELRELRRNASDEAAAQQLKSNPDAMDQMAKLLERSGKTKPEFNASQTEATFEVPPPVDGDDGRSGVKPIPEPVLTDAKLSGFGPDLKTTVAKALQALERGNVETFVRNMFPAGELRRPDADARIAALLERMTPDSAPVRQMRADLEAIREMEPEYADENRVAVYKLNGGAIGEKRRTIPLPDRTFKFQKVEGSWRLYDDTTRVRKAISAISRTAPPKIGLAPGVTVIKWEKLGDRWRLADIDYVR